MLPSFLISFRECIEAALIVATVVAILKKLERTNLLGAVWLATGCAFLLSILLLISGALLGLEVQHLYESHEQYIEGILFLISAIFITWAVFFLHRQFGIYKTHLLQHVRSTIQHHEYRGLFILVFTAVFREGMEIVLFLSTIYLSSSPLSVVGGFLIGCVAALIISVGLMTATIRLPLFQAFRATSLLLVFFAGGMIVRSLHEFSEIGLTPELGTVVLPILPSSNSIWGSLFTTIFGISKSMDLLQISLYLYYVGVMLVFIFWRRVRQVPNHESG